MKNNKGFTLVELLVATAIIGIVITAITGFMVVGSRTFASTSTEVNLQYESQLAFNQLQDLIIDTSLGVAYSYVPNGGSMTEHGVEVLDDTGVPADAAYKKLYMYNESRVYVVVWEAATSRLFYEEESVSVDASGNIVTTPILTGQRMADYITLFSADLNRLEEKRIVRVDMGFEKGDKTYQSSHNITIRNKVVVNEPLTIVNPTPVTPAGTVSVNDIWVEPGSSYDYPAPPVIPLAGAGSPSQVVKWYINMDDVTNIAPKTDIDVNDGMLKVSTYEDTASFPVTVLTADGLASAASTVNVRRVRNVGIALKEYGGSTVTESEATEAAQDIKVGDVFKLDAVVNSGAPYPELTTGVTPGTSVTDFVKIKWEADNADCLELTPVETPSGSVCTVTVKKRTPNNVIKIRAISERSLTYGKNGDSIVLGEWEGVMKEPDFEITVDPGPYERGQEYAFNVAGGDSGYIYLFDMRLLRAVYNDEGLLTGYVTEAAPWGAGEYAEYGNNCKFKFPIDMPPYNTYVVEVVCYAVEKFYSWDKAAAFYPYNGYDITNAKVSNTLRVELQPTHFYIGDRETYSTVFAPRTFISNYWTTINDNEITFVPSKGQFGLTNFRMANEFNLNRDSVTWNLYDYTSGKLVPYSLPSSYSDLLTINNENTMLKFTFRKNKWNNSVPSHLRLVPTIHVKNNSTGNKEDYLMDQSYVDIIMHNMTLGTEKLYFPFPGQDDFPGKNLSGTTAATNSTTGTWYKASNFSTTYQYRITRSETSDGEVQYMLYLYNNGFLDDEKQLVYTKKIKDGEINWVD